jgi:hypothetical protein
MLGRGLAETEGMPGKWLKLGSETGSGRPGDCVCLCLMVVRGNGADLPVSCTAEPSAEWAQLRLFLR